MKTQNKQALQYSCCLNALISLYLLTLRVCHVLHSIMFYKLLIKVQKIPGFSKESKNLHIRRQPHYLIPLQDIHLQQMGSL